MASVEEKWMEAALEYAKAAGASGEAEAAYYDSAAWCSALDRIPRYGWELSGRGWCVTGECLPDGCFGSEAAAQGRLARMWDECLERGHRPDLIVEPDGSNFCVAGGCVNNEHYDSQDGASSSSSGQSSSSGYDYSGGQCLAARPLQKPVNYYDDWVYMGREAYGSRKETMMQNYLGKFVDALGRVYGKAMGRKMYYPKSPVPTENASLELEVWARIIKDGDGRDIQVFRKEDSKRGLRKDSSFYYDGKWDVMETRNKTEVILRNSSGITTSSIRDSNGKLQESILADKNGNLIVHDKYIWKDGLLAKMITLDGVRTYHYGKNPYEDTVKVVPSDEGYLFHKGYDGSVGMIPRKGDADYENFLANPYGVRVIENELKILSRKYGEYNYVGESYLSDAIKKISYRNPERADACAIQKKSMVCPELGPNKETINGGSDIDLMLKSKCMDDGCGNYEIQHGSSIWGGMWIQQSTLLFVPSRSSYKRMCKTESSLQRTYYHEVLHFENALNRRYLFTAVYMPRTQFDSFGECEKNRLDAEDYIWRLWGLWKIAEYNHFNHDSPKATISKEEECNEIP